MLIIAGWLEVAAEDRGRYLDGCVEVVRAARAATGCLEFALGADLLDARRIMVLERWDSADDLERFRGSGTDEGGMPAIVSAEVHRYEIASVGPA